MIMNNRMEDFAEPLDAVGEPIERQTSPTGVVDESSIAFKQYATELTRWAAKNPAICLAAAFLTGATVAWIIKRK